MHGIQTDAMPINPYGPSQPKPREPDLVVNGPTRYGVKWDSWGHYAEREEEGERRRPGRKPGFAKPVKDLDGGVIYSDAAAAARAIKCSRCGITQVCNRKLAHVKGHRFAYVDVKQSS